MKRIVLVIVQLSQKEIYNFISVSFNSIHISKKRGDVTYVLDAHAQRRRNTASMWVMVNYMYNDS